MKIKINKGQMLLELLLTIGLSTVLIPVLMLSLMSSRDGKVREVNQSQAVSLLKETETAVKAIKNRGWDNILPASANPYHPEVSSANKIWELKPLAATINGFTQEVFISDVYRNDAGVIDPAGTLDPSTKKITSRISWTKPFANSISSTLYVTKTLNYSQNQSTVADFTPGTFTKTAVITGTPSDGDVVLANNNKAKWCSPEFTKDAFGNDLSIGLPGIPVAVDATASALVTNPNDVVVAMATDSASPAKLAYVHVTADTDPPATSLQGIFSLNSSYYSDPGNIPSGVGFDNNFKTNNIKLYKSPGGKKYALTTTDLPNREVIAILLDDNNSLNDNSNSGEYQDYQASPYKLYKYWTFFNTRIYANSPSVTSDTDFHSPTSNTIATGGHGDGFETYPDGPHDDSGNYARDDNSGTGTGTNCDDSLNSPPNQKDKHQYYNFNINVPSGANIKGIEVYLNAWTDNTSGSPKMCVQLSSDGGTTWTAPQSTTTLGTTTSSAKTLGGNTDTWGRTWNSDDFTNSKFRLRITNVASNTSRDFRLDWLRTKIYYDGSYDQAAFGHGASALAILNNTGYVASGGYLYVFDLSNIDNMTQTERLDNGLPMKGCRILLDGFECQPGYGTDLKYTAGETGTSWSSTAGPAHAATCYDGGNIELYSNNDIYPVKVGSNTYIYTAIGAGTNPEFEIADVSTIPSNISASTCGRGSNTGWKVTDSLDFNDDSGTEEAANSVFAKSDGTRAYISSNGGDAKQFYILNTSTKNDIKFLSGTTSPPTSGYYYGTSPNSELYVRRSLTVLNGDRAVLIGKDGISNSNNAQEYQVLDIEDETKSGNQAYCAGINYDVGINDLTSVSEADYDNYVYLVTNSNDQQLKVIQGGADDAVYVQSGQFESKTIDATQSSVFNRFTADVSTPGDSNIKLQVAVAPHSGSNCPTLSSDYNFIGPDKTSGSFFTPMGSSISAQIPFGSYGTSPIYKNPSECFRYKAWLDSSSDQHQTPRLLDFYLNYSQ